MKKEKKFCDLFMRKKKWMDGIYLLYEFWVRC